MKTKPRIKRGMRFSPIARLLVDERELPKIKRAATERQKQYHVRRTFITGGIVDIIGEGEYTRIWIGRSEKSVCLATITKEQMRDIIVKFQEALTGVKTISCPGPSKEVQERA